MLALLASSLLVHPAISGGFGNAYDYLGVRIEARIKHVSFSLALGMSGVEQRDETSYGVRNVSTSPAVALSFFWGDGDGFLVRASYAGHSYERSYDSPYAFDKSARLDTLALALGWRFLSKVGPFLELGVGPGVATRSGHPSVTGHDSTPGPARSDSWLIFDAFIGVGFEL